MKLSKKCEEINLYVYIFNAVQQPKQDEAPFACFISYWQTQNKLNLVRKHVSDTYTVEWFVFLMA